MRVRQPKLTLRNVYFTIAAGRTKSERFFSQPPAFRPGGRLSNVRDNLKR